VDYKGFEYIIKTIDPLLYSLLYNLLKPQLEALWEYLTNALRKKWIQPFTSLIKAPILFILKKDRGLRLRIDYYSLNKIIIKNRYPLPLINKTLD
jgi:hypothetical protein